MRIETTDRDFMFPLKYLILGGQLTRPQRGDRITVVERIGENEEVFEVLAPGGAQPYTIPDPEGLLLTVYAKRIQ